MLKTAAVLFAGLALAGATVPLDAPPLDPAAAIAKAEQARDGQVIGLFRMQVAAVGKSGKITFLNSNADYRSAGNLTFSLSEAAVVRLVSASGMPNAEAIRGRVVVVAGRVERRAIVNVKADGKTMGFNRWSYSVRVSKPEQLVSISAN